MKYFKYSTFSVIHNYTLVEKYYYFQLMSQYNLSFNKNCYTYKNFETYQTPHTLRLVSIYYYNLNGPST